MTLLPLVRLFLTLLPILAMLLLAFGMAWDLIFDGFLKSDTLSFQDPCHEPTVSPSTLERVRQVTRELRAWYESRNALLGVCEPQDTSKRCATTPMSRQRRTVVQIPLASRPAWWSRVPLGVGLLGSLLFAQGCNPFTMYNEMQKSFHEFDQEVRSWSPEPTCKDDACIPLVHQWGMHRARALYGKHRAKVHE